ncbi:MAG: cobalt-precorrin-6A reductase [Litoreibacter sp.]|nr:cobalt-precorrin-6A reductase [Litoreibacter sp.]
MNILLLAGTGEARELATRLTEAGHHVTASLSGATRGPADLGCGTRSGGFGGDAGFSRWLEDHPVDLVVDATHPFAHRISGRTARICAAKSIPYLQILREQWGASQEDKWIFIDHPSDATKHIEPDETVFLATGRQTLEDFDGLKENRLICRQIDPPEHPFPFPNGEFLVGRPPFSVADEVTLFKRLGVDWLVVKNAGGAASRSKLDAAREMGLRVLMLNRPPQPDAPKVATVQEALDWVEEHASD